MSMTNKWNFLSTDRTISLCLQLSFKKEFLVSMIKQRAKSIKLKKKIDGAKKRNS